MSAFLLIAFSGAAERAAVAQGEHAPFYPPDESQVVLSVAAFSMDVVPVTNAEFAAFVDAHPEWRRGGPPAVFADAGYLSSWRGPADSGGLHPEHPVTGVSWFAARAYCQAGGGELPTVYQWEYAADATAAAPHGGREDPEVLAAILAWYGADPGERLRPVGAGAPNFWGLYDMHGLIWEWTLDFNSQLISADIREAGEGEGLRFCGAGALSARDVQDYASFMRFAMRSSLGAAFTTDNLGFRCAYSS